MLPKLIAAFALIVLFSALATVGVVYYQDSAVPPEETTVPCSRVVPVTDDEPGCCKTGTDDQIAPLAPCCGGLKAAK
jgi:hypothetical protein